MTTRKRSVGDVRRNGPLRTLQSIFKAPHYVAVEYKNGLQGTCGHSHRTLDSVLKCENRLLRQDNVRKAQAMTVTNEGTVLKLW